MAKKYLRRGLGLITSGVVMGSIPTMGIAGAETAKSNAMTGLGNISSTLPAQGKLIGTGMVLRQVRKLKRRRR